MANFISIGDTIEGKTVDCVVRRCDLRGMKKHPITQETFYLYVTDYNSKAEIVKAILPPEDESLRDNTAHFHREPGDTLLADSLSIYVDKKCAIRLKVEKGVSGRHGAQTMRIAYRTIAEIRTALDIYKKKLGLSPNTELKAINQ